MLLNMEKLILKISETEIKSIMFLKFCVRNYVYALNVMYISVTLKEFNKL